MPLRRLVTWLIIAMLSQGFTGIVAEDCALSGPWQVSPFLVAAWADETWKQEFEDVCARAGDQEGLSAEDLEALLARCDALKTAIEGLEESTKKVYLTRL